jgi:hypothetical protein
LIVCAVDIFTTYSILIPAWPWWAGTFLLYLLTLIIAIPSSFYNKNTASALLHVPALALSMVRALLRIKQNKKGFLHTPKEFSN